MTTETKNQKGFTLVEIAIVLVIIGLLLGGVLKGQEIIQNAKFKNAVNQYNGIVAAAYSYQDRYTTLPGDDPGATRFTGVTAVGNGNGTIGGAFNSVTANDESRLFFQHLRAAGLIKGSGTDQSQPTHPWGGIVGVDDNIYNMDGTNVCFDNLAGDVAEILDRQNDDGVPSTGSVQGNTTQTAYIPANEYDVCFKF